MGRTIVVAVGLILAGVFSQVPEFVQQYRQRLGGAIDELTKIVTDFDADAEKQGMERRAALDRLSGNPDPLAAQRGTRMRQTITRFDRLERQRRAFENSGPVYRMVAFARDFDGEVAEGAYADFEPAVPVTVEGLIAAALGFFLALFGGGSVSAVNRWRRARREKSEAPPLA